MMRKIGVGLTVGILSAAIPAVALAEEVFKPSHASVPATMLATALTVIMAVLFIIVAVLLGVRAGGVDDGPGRIWPVFLLTAVLAVMLRVIAALAFEGYSTDIACFKSWATSVYEIGLPNFYQTVSFCDYPPGYMYVLYGLGFLQNFFSIDVNSSLFTLMVKLPSIISEVVLALIVCRIAMKEAGRTFGLLCGAMVLFNPAMFFNSSVWGQVEAVLILFAVLCIYYLRKENYWLGALFYGLALLLKPQAIMLAPVVGLAYIYELFKKDRIERAILRMIGGAAIVAAVFAAGVIPFTGTQPPDWVLHKYIGVIEEYQFATVNAFNLYGLLGANWVEADKPLLFMSYQYWGLMFIVLTCVAVGILQWRSRAQRAIFDVSGFLILSVYMFSHAMHERYMLPACALLLMAYVFTRDMTTLTFAVAFSITALFAQIFTLYADSVMVDAVPMLVISAANLGLYLIYAILTIRKLGSGTVLIKSPSLNG
jgi:dolichyl-phosphate-mannose-protein mannosyltransferase